MVPFFSQWFYIFFFFSPPLAKVEIVPEHRGKMAGPLSKAIFFICLGVELSMELIWGRSDYNIVLIQYSKVFGVVLIEHFFHFQGFLKNILLTMLLYLSQFSP